MHAPRVASLALLVCGLALAQDTPAEPSPEAKEAYEQAQELRNRLNYKEAIAKFDRAIELAPTYSAAYYDRGACRLKIGSFFLGILDFSRALELNPRHSDVVSGKLIQISYLVDVDRVIAELDKHVAADPETAHVVFIRGYFYAEKCETKQPTEADLKQGVADFDATLKLNPKFVAALIYRGFVRTHWAQRVEGDERTRHYTKAVDDFRAALKLDPKSQLGPYFEAILWARRMEEDGVNPEQRAAHRKKALDELGRALKHGFKGYDRIRNEKAFDPLRKDEDFRDLLR